MTPAARRRQFVQLERKVAFARKGKREEAQAVIRAERLKDLRAVADRTREGWMPTEPVQPDMFYPMRPVAAAMVEVLGESFNTIGLVP